jgi:hypothetical protein
MKRLMKKSNKMQATPFCVLINKLAIIVLVGLHFQCCINCKEQEMGYGYEEVMACFKINFVKNVFEDTLHLE